MFLFSFSLLVTDDTGIVTMTIGQLRELLSETCGKKEGKVLKKDLRVPRELRVSVIKIKLCSSFIFFFISRRIIPPVSEIQFSNHLLYFVPSNICKKPRFRYFMPWLVTKHYMSHVVRK